MVQNSKANLVLLRRDLADNRVIFNEWTTYLGMHTITRIHFNLDVFGFRDSSFQEKMSARGINRHRPHDSVLAGYKNFLNNSKLDENGNPFSETLVRVSRLPDWTLTKHRKLGVSVAEGGDPLRHKADGPPSLWNIIKRFLSKNLENLSVEALEAVPWEVMKHIWADVLTT